MPTNEALQVFYGTVPLILIVVAAWLRESMLLNGILARLTRVVTTLTQFKDEVHGELAQVRERLVVIETRAGIIYHP